MLSEESFGLFAIHLISLDDTGVMRFLSRLKVSARSLANSYLFRRVAPAKWKIPVSFRSKTSRIMFARLVFNVGEFHWSVTIFAFSFLLSLFSNHNAKFILPVAGVDP